MRLAQGKCTKVLASGRSEADDRAFRRPLPLSGLLPSAGFEAAFRRRGLWKQDLEHAPKIPALRPHTADADSELAKEGSMGFNVR
jgi:hypothetical protein